MQEDFNLPEEFDAEYEANIALSYEYVDKSIKELQDLSNQTNTQLGLLIGFNFTFIRFFISGLPDNSIPIDNLFCNSCLLLKLLAYLFAGISIFCCFRGLYLYIEYGMIPPSMLISKCKKASTIKLKLGIIEIWNEKLQQFIALTDRKKQLFNRSIVFWGISVLCILFDYAIDFGLRASLH